MGQRHFTIQTRQAYFIDVKGVGFNFSLSIEEARELHEELEKVIVGIKKVIEGVERKEASDPEAFHYDPDIPDSEASVPPDPDDPDPEVSEPSDLPPAPKEPRDDDGEIPF